MQGSLRLPASVRMASAVDGEVRVPKRKIGQSATSLFKRRRCHQDQSRRLTQAIIQQFLVGVANRGSAESPSNASLPPNCRIITLASARLRWVLKEEPTSRG